MTSLFEGHKSTSWVHSDTISICGSKISKGNFSKSVRNGYFINYDKQGRTLGERFVENNLR